MPNVMPNRALVFVDDPLAAYHRLASHDRARRQWRVFAVTGSVGLLLNMTGHERTNAGISVVVLVLYLAGKGLVLRKKLLLRVSRELESRGKLVEPQRTARGVLRFLPQRCAR